MLKKLYTYMYTHFISVNFCCCCGQISMPNNLRQGRFIWVHGFSSFHPLRRLGMVKRIGHMISIKHRECLCCLAFSFSLLPGPHSMGGAIHTQDEWPRFPGAHPLWKRPYSRTQKYVSSSPQVGNINYVKSSLYQIDIQTHLLTS